MLVVFLCLFTIFPKHAYARRSAGGGDLAEFDSGKYIGNLAIGVATAAVGSVAGSAISSALNGTLSSFSLSNAFTQSLQFGNMLQGFNTVAATSQVGRAVSAYGTYNDWSPSTTFVVSSVATGVTSGALNPEIYLGQPLSGSATAAASSSPPINPIAVSSIAKGVAVGGLEGLAKGATIYAIDKSRIDSGKGPSAIGQIAGMTTGMMAVNFSREIFNPADKPVISVQGKQDEGALKIEVDGKTYDVHPVGAQQGQGGRADKVIEVADISRQAVAASGDSYEVDINGKIYSGTLDSIVAASGGKVVLPQVRFYQVETAKRDGTTKLGKEVDLNQYNSEKYMAKAGAGDVYTIYDRNPSARPAKAALDTFREWPTIVTKGAGILAGEALPEGKQYLAPLVSGLAEAVTGPVVSNLADVNNLRPNFGNKQDKIATNLEQRTNIINAATEYRSAKDNARISREYNRMQDKWSQEGKTSATQSDLADLQNVLGIGDIDPEQMKAKVLAQYKDPLERQRADQQLSNLPSYGGPETVRDWAMVNSRERAGRAVTDVIASGGSTKQAIDSIGVTRSDLFRVQTWDGLRFELFDSVVSGTIQAVANKNLNSSSSVSNMGVSYAANMLTATIRGIAWNKSRISNSEDWNKSLFVPKPEGQQVLSTGPSVSQQDIMNSLAQRGSYEEERKQYLEAAYRTGLKPSHHDVGLYGKEAYGITVGVLSQKPTLGQAVGLSIAQASAETVSKTFSFGRPAKWSEDVTAMDVVNYTDSVQETSQSIAQKGWANTLANSYVNANIGATANNIQGTVAQSYWARKAFNIRPERIVATNSPKMPFTLQQMEHNAALGTTFSDMLAPFPNPFYTIRANSGKLGEYRIRSKEESPNITEVSKNKTPTNSLNGQINQKNNVQSGNINVQSEAR
jgi:hypothetical protein